jgi:hypothetical protein
MHSKDPFEGFRKWQETMRNLTESPVLAGLRKQQELFRSPVLDPFRQQQESMRLMTHSPVLDAFRKQRELLRSPLLDALRKQQELLQSPVLDAFREQQESMRKLTESPVLDALRKQQELLQSPVLEAFREQQETMRKLTNSATFTQLQGQGKQIAAVLSGPALDPLQKFRDALESAVFELAEQELPDADERLSDDEVAARLGLFNARVLQLLLWRMEGLLRVLEALAGAGFAVNEISGDQVVDPSFIAVVVMVVLVGELVLWFAEGPPPESD